MTQIQTILTTYQYLYYRPYFLLLLQLIIATYTTDHTCYLYYRPELLLILHTIPTTNTIQPILASYTTYHTNYLHYRPYCYWGRRDRDLMVVVLPIQSVPITTNVRIPFMRGVLYTTLCDKVCDLQQVGGFLRFPPAIKLTAVIQLKYC